MEARERRWNNAGARTLTMIFAEKIVTAVQRGTANTRWRDFADIYLLSGQHDIESDELRESIHHVASHRRVILSPLAKVLAGYAEHAQSKWSAWTRKQGLSERVPVAFDSVLVAIQQFADPLLVGPKARCPLGS